MSAMEHIASEAVDWFMRLREPDVPERERVQFAEWLLRSPEHIHEYLSVARAWGDIAAAGGPEFAAQKVIEEALRVPAPPPNVVQFPTKLPEVLTRGVQTSTAGQRRYLKVATIAATFVLLTAALGLAYDRWFNPNHVRTATGEIRDIALGDGSTMVLNTGSRVRIAYSDGERRIRLLEGEARFTVAPDKSRPFTVIAPTARVRALGTVFNVRSLDGQTAVAVLDGRVAVSPQSLQGSYALSSGQRAVISSRGEIFPDTGPSLDRASSWVEGRISFDDEPLTNIVAEINRYREQPLIIGDPSIEALRVSGTYYLQALPEFLQYLDSYRGVEARAVRGGGYVLSRKQKD